MEYIEKKTKSDPDATIILFQNSKDIFIDAAENIKINKSTAINRIQQQSPEIEVSDNFIGFTNPKGETLQLLRQNENDWCLNSPVTENGSYSYSLKKGGLTTDQIIQIVSLFFDNEDWQNFISLEHSKD